MGGRRIGSEKPGYVEPDQVCQRRQLSRLSGPSPARYVEHASDVVDVTDDARRALHRPPRRLEDMSATWIEAYAAGALAPATRRAYETDWRVFATWCATRGVPAIPAAPASVAAFLAAEADRGFRAVTVARRAAAIAAAHRAQDQPNPCDSGAVDAVMSGIRLEHGTARCAAPRRSISTPLQRLLEPIDTATLTGARDRALLLLGFAAARSRRSELVALDGEHLEFNPARGLERADRRLKDRPGASRNASRGPVRARERQMRGPGVARLAAGASIHRGSVFRRMRRGETLTTERLSDQSVALIIKRRAQGPRACPPRCCPDTRCAPGTSPPPPPPASRSARSPTSRATRTSPCCAATSAPPPLLTMSARFSSSPGAPSLGAALVAEQRQEPRRAGVTFVRAALAQNHASSQIRGPPSRPREQRQTSDEPAVMNGADEVVEVPAEPVELPHLEGVAVTEPLEARASPGRSSPRPEAWSS